MTANVISIDIFVMSTIFGSLGYSKTLKVLGSIQVHLKCLVVYSIILLVL